MDTILLVNDSPTPTGDAGCTMLATAGAMDAPAVRGGWVRWLATDGGGSGVRQALPAEGK